MPVRMMKVVWQISVMSYPEIALLYFHNAKSIFRPHYSLFLAILIDIVVPFLAKWKAESMSIRITKRTLS